MQKPQKAKSAKPTAGLQKMREHIKSLLKENEYQRMLTERKIATAEKKHTAEKQLLRLSEFLNKPNAKDKTSIPNLIARKAVKAEQSKSETTLMELSLQLEILEAEKQFLEAKLK